MKTKLMQHYGTPRERDEQWHYRVSHGLDEYSLIVFRGRVHNGPLLVIPWRAHDCFQVAVGSGGRFCPNGGYSIDDRSAEGYRMVGHIGHKLASQAAALSHGEEYIAERFPQTSSS